MGLHERTRARDARHGGRTAAAGCGGPGAEARPTAAETFQGVHAVALVRRLERLGPRAKDPLDGVQESLAARGLATTVVDVPPRPPRALAALAALNDRIAQRVDAEPEGVRRRVAPFREVGAAEAVAALGVDAAVFHIRPGSRFGPLGLAPIPPVGPEAQDRRALGGAPRPFRLEALAVAARDGTVAWIAWDPLDEQPAPGQPVNAFEAIEDLLRLLGVAPPRPADELDDPPR